MSTNYLRTVMGKIAATFYTVGKGQADQSVGGRDLVVVL